MAPPQRVPNMQAAIPVADPDTPSQTVIITPIDRTERDIVSILDGHFPSTIIDKILVTTGIDDLH